MAAITVIERKDDSTIFRFTADVVFGPRRKINEPCGKEESICTLKRRTKEQLKYCFRITTLHRTAQSGAPVKATLGVTELGHFQGHRGYREYSFGVTALCGVCS